jgi:hypothetical protein
MDIKLLQKKLAIFYYAVYFFAVVLVMFGYVCSKNELFITNELFVDIFKSIIIIYMLISIPLALRLFSRKIKEIAQIDNQEEKFLKYLRISKMRILLISITFLVGISAFYILKKTDITKPMFDFLYIAAIGAVALVFCKPAENKILSDIMNEKTECPE